MLPQHDRVRFYLDRSFTQQMAELRLVASSRVLEAEAGEVTEADPDSLRRESGAPGFRLVRIRMGGSEPIGVQQTTALTRRCPVFGRHDFARESVYAVLARHYQSDGEGDPSLRGRSDRERAGGDVAGDAARRGPPRGEHDRAPRSMVT